MNTPRMRLALLACCALFGASAPARAQGSDTAAAEALFESGRDLLRAGNAAEACPKLAESHRLDPATGTLLALALCHKAQGKFASAWAEFVDVESRARAENRADRQQLAAEEGRALRPRLSSLAVAVPAELGATAGFEIRRDGAPLGRGAWNTAVPVDGGDHLIEATATGKIPWRQHVQIKSESDAVTVSVPRLDEAPPSSGAGGRDRREPRAADTALRHTSKPWGAWEWAGVGTASAGVVALGIGGYFLSSALGKKSDSAKDCSGDACGAQGFSDRTSAVSKGNNATLFAVAGGSLVAAGAALVLVGRTRPEQRARPSVGVTIGGVPGGASLRVSGRF